MKNVIFGGFFLMMLGSVVTGCKKEIPENEMLIGTKRPALEKIQLLNENYPSVANQEKACPKCKYWVRLASADLSGAFLGGQLGSLLGPWGSLVGAGILGGTFSYGVSISIPPNDREDYMINVNGFNNEEFSLNDGNPYNGSVGKRHNQILQEAIKGGTMEHYEPLDNVFGRLSLSESELTFIDEYYSEMDVLYENAYGTPTTDNMLNLLVDAFGAESDEYLIMESYINKLEEFSEYEEFLAYTQEVESIISDESNGLSEQTVTTLLAGLATAKYSGKFWSSVTN